MANHKTGAQRYNDKMDKIFEEAKRLNLKYHGEDRGLYSGKGKYAGKREVAKKMKSSN